MKAKILPALILCGVFTTLQNLRIRAQDKRTQYPPLLANSYFGVNIGYINYPFTNSTLEPGYSAESIDIPHVAVRILLLGHQFNKNLSAQISYMRPVNWVKYNNINGDHSFHSVWMNVAGLTLKYMLPLNKQFSVYAEAGLGIITRNGFVINRIPVVKDANYASLLTGAGLQYHLNNKWDLVMNMAWSPAHQKVKQPHTIFFSGGFNFHMNPLPAERVKVNSNSGFIFPEQLLQIGYTTNGLGYGVNNFLSGGAIPIFWGGSAEIAKGFTLQYQRNVFHSRRVFALDWGAGISYWKSHINRDGFITMSLFPVFRFTAMRSKSTDLYFNYSVAGPTYISKLIIDNENTGSHFTFQDFMGAGIFTGQKRNMNAEIRISHYSNGNIFPDNAGVKIPLTFNLGYTF